MLDNHIYNLIVQIAEEHKSIWRIQNHYIKDAENCTRCIQLWESMAADKEARIGVLEDELFNHLKEKRGVPSSD